MDTVFPPTENSLKRFPTSDILWTQGNGIWRQNFVRMTAYSRAIMPAEEIFFHFKTSFILYELELFCYFAIAFLVY